MANLPKPWKETVKYAGPPVDANGLLIKREFPVGQAESLAVLAPQYAFFTPAVIYLHGRFTDAPWLDYMNERRRTVPFFYRLFAKPLFSGLELPSGDKDWNHALWMVPIAEWRALLDFLCSLTISSTPQRSLYTIGARQFTLLDPLAAERMVIWRAPMPQIEVTALGMNGNRAQIGLMAPDNSPFVLPRLERHAPDVATVAYANGWFRGDNPCLSRDDFLKSED